MGTVIATRSELLARRSREGIAQRGHALLTQKRATRQVNALEQVVIPRLAAEQRYIAATLEQRALEDRVRKPAESPPKEQACHPHSSPPARCAGSVSPTGPCSTCTCVRTTGG
jgi:ATP synthase subunit D